MFTRLIASALLALVLIYPATADTPNVVTTGFPLFAKVITPHDSNVLTDHNSVPTDQFVYVGSTGDVSVIPSGNTDAQIITFTAVPAGSFLPVKCRKVRSTATTASGLIGIF